MAAMLATSPSTDYIKLSIQWNVSGRVYLVYLEQSDRLAYLSVSVSRSDCQSVRWVNCGKTADWIWMPFGVVSGVVIKTKCIDFNQILHYNNNHQLSVQGEKCQVYQQRASVIICTFYTGHVHSSKRQTSDWCLSVCLSVPRADESTM